MIDATDAELPRTAGLASCAVGTTLDQANLNTSVFTESGGAHSYADLDEFNRPTRWNWERIGGASGGFSNTAVAYDENSNPVSTTDAARARNNTAKHPFDVVYGLDSLNRVISADEGNIDAGAIESGTRTRKELWNSLSLTGNWGNRQLDANGDGDFGDEADRDEPGLPTLSTRAGSPPACSGLMYPGVPSVSPSRVSPGSCREASSARARPKSITRTSGPPASCSTRIFPGLRSRWRIPL